ncbi:MAG: NADP-reducing hydrogenase subunit HndD [Eubacteriales bacterium SKADARSKE-1]|nr:NADP-reducing hydrogenase subunit HndD [Eubacteriales bacterium SKADARSKE-1]
METVNIKINGKNVKAEKGSTILETARKEGIIIPTLCYLKGINEIGACRMCVVEVKGAKSLVASCVYPVSEGMEILTNSPTIQKSRKTTLELLLSNHNRDCLSCERNTTCELQKLANDFGIENAGIYDGKVSPHTFDDSSLHLIRDNSKCILCRRCEAACRAQHVAVIGANNRGFDTQMGCAFEKNLADVPCVSCGQCIVSCPTGALRERDCGDDVMDAINDPEKYVIVHTAPSIRVTLGECFDMPIGSNVKGKMVSALRRLGFDKVFDTDFGADLTIMEESHELIDRIKNKGVLPLITSCSPGWIKFCEYYYPDLIPNLSTCKSPQQMQGAIIKTWYAKENGLDPKNIVVVSVMPCTAKKFEIVREDENAAGAPDNDFSLTTRELSRMIKTAGIDFKLLPDEEFDPILGVSTGASAIFGATGGVMEAALRTAADTLTGKSLENIDYKEIRGNNDIREAVYNIAGMDIKVAVTSGLNNAVKILDKIRDGTADYHFVEIMCCPGGCINGGGQPTQSSDTRNFVDLKGLRSKALYEEDKNLPLRKSHESPAIKKIYDEFLGEPGSKKAHEILHTSYVKRDWLL